MGLSRVVGSIAVCPADLGWAVSPFVPFPVTFVLFHVAATGFVVATAASETLADRTAGLLGKVITKSFSDCTESHFYRLEMAKFIYGAKLCSGPIIWAFTCVLD